MSGEDSSQVVLSGTAGVADEGRVGRLIDFGSTDSQYKASCDSGYVSLDVTPLDRSKREIHSPVLVHPPTPVLNRTGILDCVVGGSDNDGFNYVVWESLFSGTITYQDGAIQPPTEGNNVSTPTDQKASEYSFASDRSPTDLATREGGSGSSTGASTQSDSSEDTTSPSPANHMWLTMAYAKHRIMVSLMRGVYTIFNSQRGAEFSSRTESQAARTGGCSRDSSFDTPTSTGKGKRQREDRDSHSPDANDNKKRKTSSRKSKEGSQGRLFACCFYKYNARKYCSNSGTGTKYRSCQGPGFSKISQLKQHLKRNHRAPIYCPRCWLVMTSQAEMTLHANAEERCERKEPQIQEGVDHDKIRMITETWGVSWEGIYEILFPGAPIPSPYYEADDLSPDSLEPPSPRSQELRDFDIYNRTTLPLLVEANLRAMVESEIAPIEDRVRSLVVDIVRTCQSTVARNFHLMVAPASSANDQTQPSTQTTVSTEAGEKKHEESTHANVDDIGGSSLDFYREPPHLDAEASASSLGSMYNYSSVAGNYNQSSDSGYGSLPNSCSCSCHDYSNAWNTTHARLSCQSCASRHFDFNESNEWDLSNPIFFERNGLDRSNPYNFLDWNDLDNGPEA